jgi:hypothetical protein
MFPFSLRMAMSAPWKGKHLSEEHKAGIRAGVLAAVAAGVNIGNKGTKKSGSGGNSLPCYPGCKCGRHSNAGNIIGRVRGPQTEEWRANISSGLQRHAAQNGTAFYGGKGELSFADTLCPAGFIREYVLWFGNKTDRLGRATGRCRMDFAHVEGKIDIEIDGISHDNMKQQKHDVERDGILRNLGWRVIRIRV